MKKILLMSSASVLFATNLLANAANVPAPTAAPAAAPCVGCACPDARVNIGTGLYAGLQGGYEHMNTKYRSTYNAQTANVGTYVSNTSDSSGGFIGEVLVGGRIVRHNCMVAGLELSSVFSSAENDKKALVGFNNLSELRYTTKRKFGFLASGVFGWLLNDRAMVYTKAGVAVTGLERKVFDDLAVVARVNRHKKTYYGFAPAIGMEYGFSPKLSVRGEFGGEFYSKNFRTYLIADPAQNLQDNLRLRGQTYMLNAKVGVLVKI